MAGQPLKQELYAVLERLAKEELGEDATALDYACAQLEGGVTIKRFAQKLRKAGIPHITRQWLSKSLHRLTPDAPERLLEARRIAMPLMVEQAMEIIDRAPTDTREQLDKAKERSRVRLWQAERLARETYGEPSRAQQVNVFNLGQLHKEAFEALGKPSQNGRIATQEPVRAILAPPDAGLVSPPIETP